MPPTKAEIAKKEASKTYKAREELEQNALSQGWRKDNFGRYYNIGDDGVRVRIVVRRRTVSIERKVPLTKEEKAKDPNRFMKWEIVDSCDLIGCVVEITKNKAILRKPAKPAANKKEGE